MQVYQRLLVCVFISWSLEFKIFSTALSKCCLCKNDNFIVPRDYNKNVAPLETEGKPTSVYMNIEVMDIDEITEERMEYSMQFYVNEYWKDPRLNISFSGKTEQIPMDVVQDMWTPDIIFENSKGGWVYQLAIPNIFVETHMFDYLHRFTRYNMKISCSMNLHSYPMDTQRCFLSITSLASNKLRLELKWLHERSEEEQVDIPDLECSNIRPLKYFLANVTTSKYDYEYAMSGTFTTLRSSFIFVRHLSSHIFNVYIPSGLVVALSFMSFWLNIRSVPARVALGLTSLLTLSTQASQARNHLPPINYLTAIDVWLFVCILLVFFSLIEYATVYHLYSSKVRSKAVSPSKAWSSKDARCLVSSELSVNNSGNGPAKSKQQPSSDKMGADFDEEIQILDKISRFLFPSTFFIFSLVYWIGYLN